MLYLQHKRGFFYRLNLQKGMFVMKNVNKYYLFTKDEPCDIWNILTETFGFIDGDFEISDDITNRPFDMVDLGKAEASLIL